MSMTTLPGFTADASLYKRRARYRKHGSDAATSVFRIVPASTCCAPCGKDLCCDECPDPPDPGDNHPRPEFRVFRFRLST
jgi:hypothetical protein